MSNTPEPIDPPHWDEHQIHHVAQVDGRTLSATQVDLGTLLIYRGKERVHHHALALGGVPFEEDGDPVSVVFVLSHDQLAGLVAEVATRLEAEPLDQLIAVMQKLRETQRAGG